jgi:hypothetical protein
LFRPRSTPKAKSPNALPNHNNQNKLAREASKERLSRNHRTVVTVPLNDRSASVSLANEPKASKKVSRIFNIECNQSIQACVARFCKRDACAPVEELAIVFSLIII